MSSGRDMVIRLANARERFVAYCQEFAGMSESDANEACDYMTGEKLVKLCPRSGQWTVKHGALLEPAVLQRAAELGHERTEATWKLQHGV